MASSSPQIKTALARTRILIADDQPAIRKMVRSTLEHHTNFEVCGEVEDGGKAVEAAANLLPDVVVLNISMPVLNGFQAAREIRATLPETVIVILSANTDQHFIEEARKAGARAYVTKTESGNALIKTIEAAIAGGDFIVVT